ncbi:MAG: flagellar basal body P-ring formation protein FlgA [Nitrospinae bacterium]|nr:flagellar basal body P-ring formation protein FlgA [Nitrospinota bacterium]
MKGRLFTAVTIVLSAAFAAWGGEAGPGIIYPANSAVGVKQAVKDKVAAELNAPGRVVESVEVFLPGAVKIPAGADSLEVTMPSLNRTGDRIYATITLKKGETAIGRISATATARVTLSAVVAAREIKRNAIIAPDDVRVEKLTVGGEFDRFANDVADVAGKLAERAIKTNAPVRPEWLSTPRLVNTGDTVSIIAGKGALQISVTGQAKQAGDMGDRIRVVNAESGRQLSAKITGPAEVTVEF